MSWISSADSELIEYLEGAVGKDCCVPGFVKCRSVLYVCESGSDAEHVLRRFCDEHGLSYFPVVFCAKVLENVSFIPCLVKDVRQHERTIGLLGFVMW